MAAVDSSYSGTQEATVATGSWWLKDPDSTAYDLELDILSNTMTALKPGTQSTFVPLNSTRKRLVEEDQVLGHEFQLSISCVGDPDYTALASLRALQKTLLFQSPYSDQWYVRFDQSTWREEMRNVVSRWRVVAFTLVETDVPG